MAWKMLSDSCATPANQIAQEMRYGALRLSTRVGLRFPGSAGIRPALIPVHAE